DAAASPGAAALSHARKAPAAGAAAPSNANAAASSQALAVLRPPNPHQQTLHPHCYFRNASLPYSGGVPGSSPPCGRPLPVPVGSLPPYGSPQLPFAFTPSVQSMSLASLHQALVPLGYFGAHVGGAPSREGSRAVSGRDITYLATIRRPSWSSRSGSLDPSLASAGAAGALMPSLSPLHDLLESSYSNASTPGAQHARPDSSDHNRRLSQRCRNPSSSSASAIFSLSPSSAVPGSSPPPHLHHHHHHHHQRQQQQQQQRRLVAAAGPAKAAAGAAEAGGGDGASGGGCNASDVGRRKSKVLVGPEHIMTAARRDATGSGGDGTADSSGGGAVARSTTEGDGAFGSGDSGGEAADRGEDLVPQLDIMPAETAVQYDMYGPYGDADADPGLCPLVREDSESDLLPFALDKEGLVLSPAVASPGAPFGAAAVLTAARAGPEGRTGHNSTAGPVELTLSIAQARERDVAVGAFVRMMVDAAPLAAPPGHPAARELTPRQALAELEQLATRIRAVLEAAAPQLAAAAATTATSQLHHFHHHLHLHPNYHRHHLHQHQCHYQLHQQQQQQQQQQQHHHHGSALPPLPHLGHQG
ncbi:hypothetical protein Vretimale_16769, partial [Volvox reticuliferus]